MVSIYEHGLGEKKGKGRKGVYFLKEGTRLRLSWSGLLAWEGRALPSSWGLFWDIIIASMNSNKGKKKAESKAGR